MHGLNDCHEREGGGDGKEGPRNCCKKFGLVSTGMGVSSWPLFVCSSTSMAFHSGLPECLVLFFFFLVEMCLVLLVSKENFYGNFLLCRNFNSRINIKFDPVYTVNNIKCHTQLHFSSSFSY
ncbi:unnamed protein product [Prunus armeniaca]